MRRAQEGDRAAYESLLLDSAGLVRERARRRGIRPDRVDDVVQEALVSVHRARHTYDPARAFLPWLHAIADHRIADAFRGQRRRREVEVGEDDPVLESVPAPAEETDPLLKDGLRSALDALPARQRRVIEMMKMEDRSVREVSEELGISEASVKVLAHRGYKKLRERLRGWFDGR